MLAGLPDPVIALDRDGDVLALNAARDRDRAGAAPRRAGVAGAARCPRWSTRSAARAPDGGAQRVEFFERVPVDRWYEAIVTPIARRGRRRRPARGLVLVTFHDLTPLRRVEEMRADFVANASHELRTPLAALSGFIETLQGPARDDAAARERFLAIMQAQATRMARLIDDLLSLSRIELNAHLRPDTQVDLVADRPPGRRRPADAGARPRRRGQAGIAGGPLVVLGDRDELLRVFENLIENALKYGASGKRVEIALSVGAGPTARARRASRCATTVPASRPSICRG